MSNTEEWKTWEGRVVGGKFPLRQWLGGSDHSAVFLTDKQGQSDQKAAIKLIPEVTSDSESQRARWRAAAQLSHPNLIRIYEIGRCQINGAALLFVVMEFAEEDLSQILPQRALAASEVTEMLPPLLDALSYLHSKGLVHGRIKPSNILAVGDLLKLSSDQVTAPVQNGAGTRRDVYDAPETAAGIIAPAGDLWSVGATLVTALTQNPPFSGDTTQPDGSQPETSRRDPGISKAVPEPFRGIARECLHLDPMRRCSVADIKARMQPAGRSVPDPTPTPVLAAATRNYGGIGRILIPIAIVLMLGFGIRACYKVFPAKHSSRVSSPAEAPPVVSEPDTTSRPATAAPAAPKPAPAAPPVSLPAPAATSTASAPGAVVKQVLPEVPRSAGNTISGTIKIGVHVAVDASGKVTAAKLAPAGPSKYFAGLALRAAEQWKFSPPQVDGQPQPSSWILKFRFKRSGVQVIPEPASH